MEPQTRLHEYRPKRPPAGRPAQEHAKAALMEAVRTTRLRPIRHKRQLQMINNPVHNGNLRDEGDDLHPASALRAGHGVHLIDLPDHEGKPAAGIAAVEIALDHLFDDQPEKTAFIRFAPEDCKARTPAQTGPHTQSGTCRNDGTALGRGPSAPDVWDDRIPPWRENGLGGPGSRDAPVDVVRIIRCVRS